MDKTSLTNEQIQEAIDTLVPHNSPVQRKRDRKADRKTFNGLDQDTANQLAVKAYQEGLVTFYNMARLAWILRKKLEVPKPQ